ncbi:Metal tolerance protein 11 [Capsicum chinense]|uniref:Metal tolerance protein 11 n=1 Tax=Capsicum annuum TaxID=4072 RepID=A0A1U8GR14_CAPAN|nr:metal tolerance protein 11 isoform X2 [Capsicum annuum]KAF3618855.1 Metal tolerance protein 11 [Capsicum annuum]KAF3624601.1 Metal tolerance protein 11 [Capsicum annuum]PHT62320.1 Metal tolerance protein 11 [Capsicum annuum]PHU18559.1 Metal tolerance protein 11 [Capsicum chinense]
MMELVAHDGDHGGVCGGGGEEELLLLEANNVDRSWRLNFDELRLSSENNKEKEKSPSRGLHDCLGVLSQEDNIAVYYQQQVEMLEGFNEMDALADRGFVPGMSKEEREKLARSETTAIRISNIANMVLFAAKVYASVKSGSLAIIASTLDSLLDLLSGFILWFTAFSMQTPNPYQYPIGKKRMQPLGILVFASVMATLGLQIILESMRTLISDESDFSLTKEQERWVVGIMVFVTLVKLVLVLYCRSFTNEIVKAYAQDHFFDVITNIIGLVAALLANYITDWIDPVGAMILALYTIRTWSMTVLENVNSLVGKAAAPEYLQKLTYLCWNHHKAIKHIDTVRAYTFGSHYFVEVDIVLPADMPLQEAHDIGESLQEKLELLPEIERAFVHLDYEYSHKPEHAQAYL